MNDAQCQKRNPDLFLKNAVSFIYFTREHHLFRSKQHENMHIIFYNTRKPVLTKPHIFCQTEKHMQLAM
jgi:hypothetical protein